VNFAFMCVAVLTLPRRNPEVAARIEVFRNARLRVPVAAAGAIILFAFLMIHIWKDLNADAAAWYFHSTPVWLIVMSVGTLIYFRERAALQRAGVDLDERFRTLPPE